MPELERSKQMVLRGERMMEALHNTPELIRTDGVGPFSMFADDLTLSVRDAGAAEAYFNANPIDPTQCEAHPFNEDAPAYWQGSLTFHIVEDQAIPVVGDHLVGSLQLERMLLLCLDCALWRMNIAHAERFAALEEYLWTVPELRMCNHITYEQAGATWVCGAENCSWDQLFCEACADRHSFAHHTGEPERHGCEVCGVTPIYVPLAMPMTRLWARATVVSDTAQRAFFNGYVFALNIESTLCRKHLVPEGN